MYPEKQVTLLHSRTRLMPIYPQEMHDESESGGNRLISRSNKQS